MNTPAEWTLEETRIMRKNMSMKVSALNKLLPKYSRSQIYNKRGKMRIAAIAKGARSNGN